MIVFGIIGDDIWDSRHSHDQCLSREELELSACWISSSRQRKRLRRMSAVSSMIDGDRMRRNFPSRRNCHTSESAPLGKWSADTSTLVSRTTRSVPVSVSFFIDDSVYFFFRGSADRLGLFGSVAGCALDACSEFFIREWRPFFFRLRFRKESLRPGRGTCTLLLKGYSIALVESKHASKQLAFGAPLLARQPIKIQSHARRHRETDIFAHSRGVHSISKFNFVLSEPYTLAEIRQESAF